MYIRIVPDRLSNISPKQA